MCGRFALGVGAAELRAGVADHFPRLLNNNRDNRAPERDPSHATQADSGRRRGGGGAARARGRRDAPIVNAAEDEEEADEEDDRAGSPGIVEPRRLRGGGPGGVDPATIAWENEDRFREGNFNVAPRSNSVVIRLRPKVGEAEALRIRGGGEGGEEVKTEEAIVEEGKAESTFDVGDQELVIETMQWGLIPHWSKHPPTGPLNTINARSENLIDHGAGGMWQSLKGPKRCLVVVQGYYEWQKKGTTKIAHFTCYPSNTATSSPTASSSTLTGTPQTSPPLMLLAGLYDTVRYVDDPEDAPPHKTFTILTTTPSKSLEFLHDRMPCILDDEEELVKWLDCRDGWDDTRAKLLRPFEGKVECFPVQPEVGKVGTNSSSYILPVAKRKDGIANMFAKQVAKGSPTKPALSTFTKAETIPEKTTASASSSKSDPIKSTLQEENRDTDSKVPMPAESKAKIHQPVEEVLGQKTGTSAAKDKTSVKRELKQEGLDDFIGDDSNAPNSAPKQPSQTGKRKTRSAAKKEEAGEAEILVLSDDEPDVSKGKSPAKKRRKM